MATREQIIFSIAAEGAELTGQKITSLSAKLRGAGIAVTKVTDSTKKAANSFGRMNTSMTNLIANAVKWAVAYQIIYGVLRLITSTISDSIKAWVELDDTMAKVRTVTRDTGEGMAKIMRVFQKEVQAIAMESREDINGIADALFYLGSAGLAADEQLAALKPTITLVTATKGDLVTTVRALAGSYNTLRGTVEEATTAEEVFAHMADVIAYTFSKEEVLIGELAQGLKYVAGDAKAAGLSFDEVVAILGFLNTQLLKSGQAGRNLSQTFRQLISNSQKLAHELGITFPKDEPFNFLKVLFAISDLSLIHI